MSQIGRPSIENASCNVVLTLQSRVPESPQGMADGFYKVNEDSVLAPMPGL